GVAAPDFLDQLFFKRIGAADLDLDPFGGLLTNLEVVDLLQVLHDRFVHLVARAAQAGARYDAAQRNHRDLAGPAADVHDHGAARLIYRQPDTDGCGHGFLDEPDIAGARALGGFPHRTLFDHRDAAGHRDDHARADEVRPAVRLADEVAEHLL